MEAFAKLSFWIVAILTVFFVFNICFMLLKALEWFGLLTQGIAYLTSSSDTENVVLI